MSMWMSTLMSLLQYVDVQIDFRSSGQSDKLSAFFFFPLQAGLTGLGRALAGDIPVDLLLGKVLT